MFAAPLAIRSSPFVNRRAIRHAIRCRFFHRKLQGTLKSDSEWRTARRMGFAIQCLPRRSPFTAHRAIRRSSFAIRRAIRRDIRCRFSMSPDAFHKYVLLTNDLGLIYIYIIHWLSYACICVCIISNTIGIMNPHTRYSPLNYYYYKIEHTYIKINILCKNII